jgi:uncharacterized lipoprotein YajG
MMRISILFMVISVLTACAANPATYGSVQRITPQQLAKLMPPAVASVSLDELIADSRQGKSADEIIAKIKASNSRYDLSPTQSIALNKQGLDTKVLEYIHQSNELAKQNAIANEMNQQQIKNQQAQQALQNERDMARQRYYDTWPAFGLSYGYPWYGPAYSYRHFGPRIGWGLRYYH